MTEPDIDFEEGESYDLEDVLEIESDMTKSGNWELVDDFRLGATVDGTAITVEFDTVVCTDVTDLDDLTLDDQ